MAYAIFAIAIYGTLAVLLVLAILGLCRYCDGDRVEMMLLHELAVQPAEHHRYPALNSAATSKLPALRPPGTRVPHYTRRTRSQAVTKQEAVNSLHDFLDDDERVDNLLLTIALVSVTALITSMLVEKKH